jgi:hypothetical protein
MHTLCTVEAVKAAGGSRTGGAMRYVLYWLGALVGFLLIAPWLIFGFSKYADWVVRELR